jgi:DNA-binding CsgD family transcriptional regulator/tetratricopeptide (TPR) repeat protein
MACNLSLRPRRGHRAKSSLSDDPAESRLGELARNPHAVTDRVIQGATLHLRGVVRETGFVPGHLSPRSTDLRPIGRDVELAELADLVRGLPSTGCRMQLIGGDAGTGKTTLVEATARAAAAASEGAAGTVRGQCIPSGGDGLPYAPILGVLRCLLERYGRQKVLGWAGGGRAALGLLLPDLAGEHPVVDTQPVLFEAVAVLLRSAAAQGPLVVIVEDLHWSDESTRTMLRFLVSALDQAPVLFLVTFRTDELRRKHPLRSLLADLGRLAAVGRTDLAPLDRAATTALITRVLARPMSGRAAEQVFVRSGGIPFYVEEILAGADGAAIPATVRDVLGARLATLSDGALETVRLLAVIGRRADHELLANLSPRGSSRLERDLREAVEAGVLVADGLGYAFRHALLREAVEADLLPGERARLHRAVAEVLEPGPTDPAPDQERAYALALHWLGARDVDRAFVWSLRAARTPSAAPFEALQMYEHVLELWNVASSSESVAGSYSALLEEAASTAYTAGEFDRALELADRALADADPEDVPVRIRRLILRSRVRSWLLRPGAADDLEEASSLLPAVLDPQIRRAVLLELAGFSLITGGPDTIHLAREALAAADDERLRKRARSTLGSALVAVGREAEGLAELEAAFAAPGDVLGTLRDHVNYGEALVLVGQWQRAIDVTKAGLAVARSAGMERSLGALLLGHAAEALLAAGQWDAAADTLTDALALGSFGRSDGVLRLVSAWLSLWRGHPESAERILADHRHLIGDDHPLPQHSVFAIEVDAEHALWTGDPRRAWRAVCSYLDQQERFDAARGLPILASGAWAARVLDELEDDRRRARVGAALASLPTGMALLPCWSPLIEAELRGDEPGWRDAVEVLVQQPGAPAHLLPYAQFRLAEHLAVSRERAEAKTLISTAFSTAAALDARLLTIRLEVLATRAGLVLTSRSGSGPLAELTARELEVLRLVTAGHSNAKIGTELFISTKTASVHVSNILAKLHVRSRTEAAGVAHRSGL